MSILLRFARAGIPQTLRRALLLGAIPLVCCAADGRPERFALDLPPRKQWAANEGYCGEVSMISAGLYYGQYCSQFEARRIACHGAAQSDADSQLLLGDNDVATAREMRLDAEPWRSTGDEDARGFLSWVKSHVRRGHPVIIGVMMNQRRFDISRDPTAGASTYDHIVPVTAVESADPSDAPASPSIPSDVVLFSDNGLWSPGDVPPFFFSARFDEFPRSRRQANRPDAAPYSLNDDGRNYGIAVTGVADLDRVTLPVRLKTSVNAEEPEMEDGSDSPPAPARLELTATVTIPDPGRACVLYRYARFADVPRSRFNGAARKAAQVWRIPAHSGATFVVRRSILSNETVVFRAVPAAAP